MQKALVMGAGVSGWAAAHLLKKNDWDVTITNDRAVSQPLTDELSAAGIQLHIGTQDASLLKGIDRLITAPGIHEDHPLIQAALRNSNLTVMSEIELGLSFFKGRRIAVTGTNGKSTTTAMIAHLLKERGIKATACGNIGHAVSHLALTSTCDDVWVMELSSYQLLTSRPIAASCVVFTSFSPDHLQRHKTLENYFEAKFKLIEALSPSGYLILSPEARAAMTTFGKENNIAQKKTLEVPIASDFDWSHLPILTKHDRLNALMAAEAALCFCDDTFFENDEINKAKALQQEIKNLARFQNLPFRYNVVHQLPHGKVIINDSKATNVDSCMRALENQTEPVILLLGGQPKGESFAPLLKFESVIKEIWSFGPAVSHIESSLAQSDVLIKKFPTLQACLLALAQRPALNQETILFSPACASFDEFKNFEDRGEFFNRWVETIML